jgi:hypothetical protein
MRRADDIWPRLVQIGYQRGALYIYDCLDRVLAFSIARARRASFPEFHDKSPRREPDAMAESFVDSFKTELIGDRVWRTRSQLELAVVEYVD